MGKPLACRCASSAWIDGVQLLAQHRRQGNLAGADDEILSFEAALTLAIRRITAPGTGLVAVAETDAAGKILLSVGNVELSPGQFERRQVEIGTEKDGRVPVRAGLAPGQRIVAEGGLLLQAVLDPDN